jgi:hypothetical protein
MPLFSDIDSLIESMQSVSDEERFKLMNEFKQEVIQLQEEERMEAMLKLISITQSDNAHEVLEELKSENISQETEDAHLEAASHSEEEIVQESVEEQIDSSVGNADVHNDVEIEVEENEVENDD